MVFKVLNRKETEDKVEKLHLEITKKIRANQKDSYHYNHWLSLFQT